MSIGPSPGYQAHGHPTLICLKFNSPLRGAFACRQSRIRSIVAEDGGRVIQEGDCLCVER